MTQTVEIPVFNDETKMKAHAHLADGRNVSVLECGAMRLLTADGWSVGELSLAFERTKETVRRHIRDDCTHETLL